MVKEEAAKAIETLKEDGKVIIKSNESYGYTLDELFRHITKELISKDVKHYSIDLSVNRILIELAIEENSL